MTSKLTIEQARRLRNDFECWQQDYDPKDDKEQYDMFGRGMAAMDMLIAGMYQEPVAYTDERNLGYIDRGRETAYLWGKQNSEAGDVPLYRHAQQPVVQMVAEESRCGTKDTPALDSLPKNAESRSGNSLANDTNVVERLTITLPDTSSKAFWSGTGKTETFHPVTYRRWVKEAIERYCTIARIDVEVK